MYSSSSSSSSQQSPNPNNPLFPSSTTTTTNLSRYASAPSSLISTAADSVFTLPHHHHHHHPNSAFSAEPKTTLTFLRSYDGINDLSISPLTRHSSSPAASLNHLASDIGFSVSKGHGIESYNGQGSSLSGHKLSRLGSQMSFTKQDHHSLSQISEVNEIGPGPSQSRSTTSGFSLSSWDDSNNNYLYSASSSKRTKALDDDFLNGLAAIDSQEALEMERLFHVPQDSVPCKIRAKRGCATHPRSIAERERRTRISGKLKKLQDLVPNMDKQTSYADMLDLAVEHIKRLQDEIQKLNEDLDKCTCGCKQSMQQ